MTPMEGLPLVGRSARIPLPTRCNQGAARPSARAPALRRGAELRNIGIGKSSGFGPVVRAAGGLGTVPRLGVRALGDVDAPSPSGKSGSFQEELNHFPFSCSGTCFCTEKHVQNFTKPQLLSFVKFIRDSMKLNYTKSTKTLARTIQNLFFFKGIGE